MIVLMVMKLECIITQYIASDLLLLGSVISKAYAAGQTTVETALVPEGGLASPTITRAKKN
jgi:hypothetical protein